MSDESDIRFTFAVLLQGDCGGPLTVTFDVAQEKLARLARLFIEPDGSFVWRGAGTDGQTWQVDGNLIDRGETLAYVELKGTCPERRFDELLAALGWPQSVLSFQLQRSGRSVGEEEFRRLARESSAE